MQSLATFRDLRKSLGPFDVIHSNTTAVLAGALWSRWFSVPHVWTVREILERRPAVARVLGLLVEKTSDVATFNSMSTAKFWQAANGRLKQKSQTILNAIENLGDDDTSSAGAEGGKVVLAIVGRINAWKGHLLFLDALDRLPIRTQKHVEVVVAGEAPDGQEDYERQVRIRAGQSSMSESIEFRGFVDDMSGIYRCADVVVTPSTQPEPFGRVPLEAARYGKPTIASDCGGFRETVEHGITGLHFKTGDAADLTRAIERLVGDADERERLGAAARERWAAYTPELMAAQYVSAYRRATGDP
jgi:glycosyltransferase involved in cell wall biosynthesis